MKNKELHNEDVYLAKWLANEITDTAFKELVSEDDFLAYTKLKKSIALYGDLQKPIDTSFEKIQSKIKKSGRSKVRRLYMNWSVSIAACLLLFFSIYTFLTPDLILTETNYGEQHTIELLDGSEVIVGPRSQVSYTKENWKKNREIYLEGEAFFKVKKGSTFTVKTKNGLVQVLGTSFNVNSHQDFFEVVCYTGMVKVKNKDKTFILNPTKGVRRINGYEAQNVTSSESIPSWTQGESTYRSVPIKYVISDLEKQFNVSLDMSKIDQKMLFTGSFDHNQREMAFKTVFSAMEIDYNQTNDRTFILSSGK